MNAELKECGKIWSWPNVIYKPGIFLEWLRRTLRIPRIADF
jgi:hypothetical protein